MPCKDQLEGTCANPSCEKWHSLECALYKSSEGCKFGISAHSHTAGVRNNLAEGPRAVATKVQLLCSMRRRIWVVYISGRGAAKIVIDFTEDLNHDETHPMCQIFHSSTLPNFETKIRCSTKFAMGILLSAAPTLHFLRNGLRKRQSGKSTWLAKQHGSWQRKS